MVIEPYDDSKLDAIIRLSPRAWEPVFESLQDAVGPAVYRAFYHDDWRAAKRQAVESVCSDEDMHVWVAAEQSRTAGFVALKLHPEDRMGEIYMIAVDPDFQRRGSESGTGAPGQHSLSRQGRSFGQAHLRSALKRLRSRASLHSPPIEFPLWRLECLCHRLRYAVRVGGSVPFGRRDRGIARLCRW